MWRLPRLSAHQPSRTRPAGRPYNVVMQLTGVFAPLPTPFDEAGALDVVRLRAALPTWIRSPLTGFVVLGTNGEAGLLTDTEAARVIEETRALIPPGRPLIAGTARESTAEAIAAARLAARWALMRSSSGRHASSRV